MIEPNRPPSEEVYVLPASFAQQRLWFIEQLLPGDALYVIPLVFRLTGVLQPSCLDQSIHTIVQRHETLRTTFELVNGELMQIIAPESSVTLEFTDLRQSAAHGTDQREMAIQQIWQAIQQPFQLDRGPLFRAQLWRLQEQEHWLLLTLHHIIFDEWSSGVLIRELGQLYGALVEDQPLALPELPIQYADFAHWQRQMLQGDLLHQQLRYWKQQLQDLPLLSLPSVVHRPAVVGHRGASQLIELPQQLLDALEALSQQSGTTLFMTLLAAFQTLLHRYTGQTDIAIGSPIANRHRSELEGLIGFLVNSLVLRTDLSGDPSFRELLERVRQVTLAAYTHQDLPFEKLVEALQPVRSLSHNPLFQAVFALQNTPMQQLTLPGLVLNSVELETRTARFDLELYLWKCSDNFRNLWGQGWQQSDGLRGLIVYNPELLEEVTVTALRQQYQTLLEGIVAAPETPLSALPLLSVEQQQQLLDHWQGKPAAYPAKTGIHRLFERQVEQCPTAIALQFGEQQFTYQALNQGSNQLARYLQKLGAVPGKPIGVCLEQGAEAVAALLAVLKTGCAYLPLDPSYPAERLHWMLTDAEVTVVITQSAYRDLLKLNGVKITCLDEIWNTVGRESEQNLSAETDHQTAYVIYTSGSTGIPKGVVVPHRAVNRLVYNTNYIQIEPGDSVAQAANLAFDAATFEIWGALLNGARLVGVDRKTALAPVELVAQVKRDQISILFLTTALLNQTVSQIPTAFQSLKYLLFGGELANVEAVRLLLQQGKPQHLVHVYGPTENTTFSTWCEVEKVSENATLIPIGQAISNTQVYLLDNHLNPVPANAIGEIYLGGDGLAEGYLNRPDLTAERFLQVELPRSSTSSSLEGEMSSKPGSLTRLYRTGDRALYRTDGNLEFLGRTDRQVKLRGFRVELGEIETLLVQHPVVKTAVVVLRDSGLRNSGLRNNGLREAGQLVAYIVPEAGQMPAERELRSFLKAKLPDHMLPALWVMLDRLPLTANGKVDQQALPLPDDTAPAIAPTIAPATSLETVLVKLWQQLLGRKTIGIHDSFFELGGHSLLATQLVSRIRECLRVELPLRAVFETPTIAALSQQIEALQVVHDSETTRWPNREEVEL